MTSNHKSLQRSSFQVATSAMQRIASSGSSSVRATNLLPLVRACTLLLLVTFPILKDGPLDVDLWGWKLLAVAVLFGISLRHDACRRMLAGDDHTVFLVMTAMSLVLLSYAISDSRAVGRHLSETFLANAIALLLLRGVSDRRMLGWTTAMVAVVTFAACTIAAAQYITVRFRIDHPLLVYLLPPEARLAFFMHGQHLGNQGLRLPSFFYQSNQMGHLMVVSFGLAFPHALHRTDVKWRALSWAIIASIWQGCILTQSRGSVILITFEASAIAALSGWSTIRLRRDLLAVAVVGTLAGALLFSPNASHFARRLATGGMSFRSQIWRRTMEMIPEHLLLGVGQGSSSYEILRRYPPVQYELLFDSYHATGRYDSWSNNSHSYYLGTILETGVFSLACGLLLYSSVGCLGIRALSRPGAAVAMPYLLGGTVVLLAEFLRGLFETYCFLSAPETGAFIAVAMASILHESNRFGWSEAESTPRCIRSAARSSQV